MELRRLRKGWRGHIGRFAAIRRKLSGHQDPKVFAISCSDSRVNIHEIFEMNAPGSIFEMKNIGGLFTEEATAGLVYALRHLAPEYVLLIHHTGCGAYDSMSADDVEPEIRKHMLDNGGFHAKMNVEAFLSEQRLRVRDHHLAQLIVEEGARLQARSLLSFLKIEYPEQAAKIESGKVRLLQLIYDIVSGKVFLIPEKLEGSQDMARKEF